MNVKGMPAVKEKKSDASRETASGSKSNQRYLDKSRRLARLCRIWLFYGEKRSEFLLENSPISENSTSVWIKTVSRHHPKVHYRLLVSTEHGTVVRSAI